jgi:integrase
MAVAPFFVVSRTLPSGAKRFIVRFLNPDGSVMRSTTLQDHKIHTKTQAIREADRLLKDGIVPRAKDPFLYDFLKSFWTVDSEYAKAKARRKHSLSEQYIKQSADLVERPLKDLCFNRRLSSLNLAFLESVITELEKTGISPRTINIRIQVITVPVRWNARQNKLPDPFFGYEKLPEDKNTRGIITKKELGKLLTTEQMEPRARAAVYFGTLCGMRMGEIRGLQWEDIDFENGTIDVRHNIPSKTKTIVQPKWNSRRTIPLPTVLAETLRIVQGMPQAASGFVIYNIRSKEHPVTEKYLRKAFREALVDIGITKETQAEKNIVFHSSRHTFVSISRASGMSTFIVQSLVGHKDAATTEEYSHPEVIDYKQAKRSMNRIVDRLIHTSEDNQPAMRIEAKNQPKKEISSSSRSRSRRCHMQDQNFQL